MMNLEDVVATEAAVMRPEDTLFIAFHASLTTEEAHSIKDRIAAFAPDISVVVIDKVQSMAIKRAEDEQ